MKIQKITFIDNANTICDCCGKSLKNSYIITTATDTRITLGTTCFEKQMKSKLDKMALKKTKEALKSIQCNQQQIKYWETVTEEQYYNDNPMDDTVGKTIDTFEEYRNWMLTEFLPYQIDKKQQIIRQYAKI